MTDPSTTATPRFDAWLESVLAFYYTHNPVNATFIGVHDHDGLLPDRSLEARGRAEAVMQDLLAELTGLPDEPLTDARRHDRALAEGALRLWLWEHTSRHVALGNPSYYTGEAVFSVMALFHRDSEPVAERAAAAASRMRDMPAFLAQSRETITSAPTAWTERAIREARSGVTYFGQGFGLLMDERDIRTPELEAAAATATDAFREHLAWLEGTLLQQPSDDYAAGREAFDRYLRHGHQLAPEHDSAWVDVYARRGLASAHAALEALARDLDPSRDWRQQLATLAEDHPDTAGYYAAYGDIWRAAKDAALANNLVTWPDYPIDYAPIPPSDREAAGGLYYLFYRCPAPFGRPETHRYRVTPVEPDMPPAEREQRLRANNRSVITLNHVIHHGGLGHHVQNWHAFRAGSRIGRIAGVDGASRLSLFCAGTLVEGWACYATELMGETDFLTLGQRLSEAHNRVRMAARAIADVGIHTGVMTLEDAAAFYEREAGMTASAATSEAVKNSMFPGAAMMYLIGTDAIHDLRRALAAREGDAFSLRDFHDRFLSYGAIPVAMIAATMLAGADAEATSAAG